MTIKANVGVVMKDMIFKHKKMIGLVGVILIVGLVVGAIFLGGNSAHKQAPAAENAASESSEAGSKAVEAPAVATKPNTGNVKQDAMMGALNEMLAKEFKLRVGYLAKGEKDFSWTSNISKVESYKDKDAGAGVKIYLNNAGMKLSKADLFAVAENAHNFATSSFYNVASTKHDAFTEEEFETFFNMTSRQSELHAVLVDQNGKEIQRTNAETGAFEEADF